MPLSTAAVYTYVLNDDPGCRSAPHAPVDRLLRELLHPRIERGIDLESALGDRLFAEGFLEYVVHVRRKIRILIGKEPGRPFADERQRLRFRRFRLPFGDVVTRDHAFEDVLLALPRVFGIDVRRIVGRGRGQTRELCGLREREAADVGAEIRVGRGFDAVSTRAEIDQVEISFQDLVFGIVPFDLHREERFLDLA